MDTNTELTSCLAALFRFSESQTYHAQVVPEIRLEFNWQTKALKVSLNSDEFDREVVRSLSKVLPHSDKDQNAVISCSFQNGWSHINFPNLLCKLIGEHAENLTDLDAGILLGMKRIRNCQISNRTDEQSISVRRLSMTVKAYDKWGQDIELATSIQEGDTLKTQLRQYYLKKVLPTKAVSPIILAFPLKKGQLIGGRTEDVYSSCTLIGRFKVPFIIHAKFKFEGGEIIDDPHNADILHDIGMCIANGVKQNDRQLLKRFPYTWIRMIPSSSATQPLFKQLKLDLKSYFNVGSLFEDTTGTLRAKSEIVVIEEQYFWQDGANKVPLIDVSRIKGAIKGDFKGAISLKYGHSESEVVQKVFNFLAIKKFNDNNFIEFLKSSEDAKSENYHIFEDQLAVGWHEKIAQVIHTKTSVCDHISSVVRMVPMSNGDWKCLDDCRHLFWYPKQGEYDANVVKGFSKAGNMIRGDIQQHLPDGSTSARYTLFESFEASGFQQLLVKNAHLKGAKDRGDTEQHSKCRPNPTLQDPPKHFAHQKGALGELFISHYLGEALDNDCTVPWTSNHGPPTQRSGKQDPFNKLAADFYHKDDESREMEIFLFHDKLGRRKPFKFFIEVKATMGQSNKGFFMTENQYANAKAISKRKNTDIIYVLIRVYNLATGSPDLKFYPDPYWCLANGVLKLKTAVLKEDNLDFDYLSKLRNNWTHRWHSASQISHNSAECSSESDTQSDVECSSESDTQSDVECSPEYDTQSDVEYSSEYDTHSDVEYSSEYDTQSDVEYSSGYHTQSDTKAARLEKMRFLDACIHIDFLKTELDMLKEQYRGRQQSRYFQSESHYLRTEIAIVKKKFGTIEQ